jgi:hypothetical protein
MADCQWNLAPMGTSHRSERVAQCTGAIDFPESHLSSRGWHSAMKSPILNDNVSEAL